MRNALRFYNHLRKEINFFTFKKVILCLAVKNVKDIRLPRTSAKKDCVKTVIRRRPDSDRALFLLYTASYLYQAVSHSKNGLSSIDLFL